MEKLKSCPFCGGRARLYKKPRNNYIMCGVLDIGKCPISPNTRYWTSKNLKNVIKAWNTRKE
jgi:hypothetical protein